jgi:hypothetical protein
VKTRAEYDYRVDEWIYFEGGPKDGGWEILPKGMQEMFIPVMSNMRLWDTEADLSVTTRMITATYRYQGKQMLGENLLGVKVAFRVFEWMGER